MIVTDCGVKAVEKVRYANSQGVDIIICDHHTQATNFPMPLPCSTRNAKIVTTLIAG